MEFEAEIWEDCWIVQFGMFIVRVGFSSRDKQYQNVKCPHALGKMCLHDDFSGFNHKRVPESSQ